MTVDRIEQEILIKAPADRVWAVLTSPEHVSAWFSSGDPARIDLRPGGTMLLDHGEYGVFPTTIEVVDPPHRFSYWWAHPFPGEQAHERNATLVEFTLTTEGDGTRLRVVESGFSRLPLPPETRDTLAGRNTGGWAEKVEEVRVYTERLGT
jgi:uncharacterized protein YndB with AHSA1/START domain